MYLTLIHNGGGGQCEAADARKVIGPFNTPQRADAAGDEFYVIVAPKNDNLRRETFHSVVEIPDTPISVQDAADEYIEEWTFE